MYAKLTLKAFKERLDAGEYKQAAGARRAVGKVTGWSSSDRNKARELVDGHFGEETKATTAKPAKGKKRKAVVAKAQPKMKKAAQATAVTKPAKKAASVRHASQKAKPAKNERDILREIHITGERVGTVSQAIAAMEKAAQHGADVIAGMQIAQDVLTQSVEDLKQQTASDGNNGASDNEVARRFVESAPSGTGLNLPAES
jgi:hypothetical protein